MVAHYVDDLLISGFFTKTQALSYQKDRKNKCKYACGLMTKQIHTHTHASNDSYEHPPRLQMNLNFFLQLARSF